MVIQPAKRKRGRPRKDASLKQAEAARMPGSEGRTAYPSQRASRTRGPECVMGEAVTGFVESTFGSGYLLNVRIGNSKTYMRGVVFKPGHCAPITAENDVAPHLPMIRRSNVCFTVEKQGQSHMQTAAVVPSKRKRALVTAPSKRKRAPVPVPPVTTVATVALQPATYPNELQVSDYEDLDVHMVEPLSILPPGRDIPVGQVFVPALTYPSCEAGSEQYDDGSVGQDKNHKPETATDIDTQGTSRALEALIEGAEELLKSSPENSALDETGINYEPFLTESVHIEPMINYGAGRMTELLKAFEDNSSERQLHFAEPPPSFELHETPTTATSDSVQGSVP